MAPLATAYWFSQVLIAQQDYPKDKPATSCLHSLSAHVQTQNKATKIPSLELFLEQRFRETMFITLLVKTIECNLFLFRWTPYVGQRSRMPFNKSFSLHLALAQWKKSVLRSPKPNKFHTESYVLFHNHNVCLWHYIMRVVTKHGK